MTTTAWPATDKQVALITKLLGEKDLTGTIYDGHTVCPAGLDKRAASSTIDFMFKLPRKSASTAAPADDSELEGMHRDGGVIFKVQRAVHGSGNLYAKRLVGYHPAAVDGKCYCSDMQGVQCGVCREPELTEWSFEYAPGVIRYLSADTKMTLEEAKEFGALYGTCCVCGRTLTNESSIEAGIGPVCAGKF
jgi:hypothetical protein